MEGISLALCINFHKILPHLSLVSSDTNRNFPPIVRYPRLLHFLLYFLSSDLTIAAFKSLPLTVYGPFQPLYVTMGRARATIRVSWYITPQNGIPSVTVNIRSTSFSICFLVCNTIKRGTTTICVLCGQWNMSSNSKYRAVSIDAWGGSQRILSVWCPRQG